MKTDPMHHYDRLGVANRMQTLVRPRRLPVSKLLFLTFDAIAKMAVVASYFAIWWFFYERANVYSFQNSISYKYQIKSPNDLFPGIIQPFSASIYVMGGGFLAIVPFAYHKSWRGICFVILCYSISSTIAFSCYHALPLSIIRPSFTGDSPGERLMRWVFSVDMPGNCFPSSHAFFATFGALLVARGNSGPKMRLGVTILALAVMVTTVTTGQHYFFDAPAGVAVAWIGYGLASRFLPLARPRGREDGKEIDRGSVS